MDDVFVETILVMVLQALPEGLADQMPESLGQYATPETAMVLGGGVLSVGTVRWLVNRRAAGGGSTTTTPTSVSTTAGANAGGASHDAAFTLPGFIPLSKGVRSVSHNEVHAVELGLVVGVVAAWLFSTGRSEIVYTMLVAFVAGSLGYKRYGSKAFKTIRYEPWYALIALSAGGALGWALFMMEPSLLAIVRGA